MALPKYDKTKRRKSYEPLPKGAYVVKIMGAKEEANKNGSGTHLTIAFDIAEGDLAGFYNKQFEANTAEDKKWPNDAIYYLNVPDDDSQAYVWTNWNTFFADLEDSNNGFILDGDPKLLKGKLIGGKFRNEPSAGDDGTVYDHIRLAWTCVADDVRSGNYGKMPNDKQLRNRQSSPSNSTAPDNDFVSVPDGIQEELPF